MQFRLRTLLFAVALLCVIAAFPWYVYFAGAVALAIAMVTASIMVVIGAPLLVYWLVRTRRRSEQEEQM